MGKKTTAIWKVLQMTIVLFVFVGCYQVTKKKQPNSNSQPSIPASPICQSDADCDNGVFCDGKERCFPKKKGADARGCIVFYYYRNTICNEKKRVRKPLGVVNMRERWQSYIHKKDLREVGRYLQKRSKAGIEKCYFTALKSNPRVEGLIRFSFVATKSGLQSITVLSNSLRNQQLEQCITRVFTKTRFSLSYRLDRSMKFERFSIELLSNR